MAAVIRNPAAVHFSDDSVRGHHLLPTLSSWSENSWKYDSQLLSCFVSNSQN